MATANELNLITNLRDALQRVLTGTVIPTRAQDPGAYDARDQATNLLLNPLAFDPSSEEPVYGYATTIAGVNTHVHVTKSGRVKKLNTTTKLWELL